MEGEQQMGAGPETTGIEYEQLQLFVHQHHVGIGERRSQTETDIPAIEPAVELRHHWLGLRPDRLHTSDHPGVRGDRLEGSCRRPPRKDN